MDFHQGRPGETGWKEKDHWHDSACPNGPKEHLEPDTEVPDGDSLRSNFPDLPPIVPMPIPPIQVPWLLPVFI